MSDDPNENQPILLMAPGLGGETEEMYTRRLLWHAKEKGFKVGTIHFRNTKGVPVTSNKLNYAGAWPDLKAVIEHVSEKYLIDKKTGKKRTTFYVFGCSLGAIILGNYLINEPENSSKLIDGSIIYSCPWEPKKGSDYFYNNCFGLYQYFVGNKLNR